MPTNYGRLPHSNQQDLNHKACAALTARGWNGSALRGEIKETKVHLNRPITKPQTRECQELIAMATRAGACYHATGGGHITSDDVFKSLEVGKRKAEANELAKMKESCIDNMALQEDCHDILFDLDGQPPNGKQLKKHLKWQGEKEIGKTNKTLRKWQDIFCKAEHEIDHLL